MKRLKNSHTKGGRGGRRKPPKYTTDLDLDIILKPGLMNYPCGKFGDCSFSRFGSIMQKKNKHTRQTRIKAILPRLSSA